MIKIWCVDKKFSGRGPRVKGRGYAHSIELQFRILSLLTASIFLLVSAPVVAQQLPTVRVVSASEQMVTADGGIIDFTIGRTGSTARELTVIVRVTDNSGPPDNSNRVVAEVRSGGEWITFQGDPNQGSSVLRGDDWVHARVTFAANENEATVMVRMLTVPNSEMNRGTVAVHVEDAEGIQQVYNLTRQYVSGDRDRTSDPAISTRNEDTPDPQTTAPTVMSAAQRTWRPLEAHLPRFGRAVGGQTTVAVRNRISANRNAGFQGQIAGQAISIRESGDARQTGAHNRAVLLTLLEQGVDATLPLPTTSPSSWSLTSEEVLLGTSFAFMRDTDAGMSLGFWGQASQSGFGGHGVAGNIDGRVTGVQLGADWRQGAGLFGLMVSRSRSSGDVAGTTTAAPGDMKSDLTALVPYGGFEVSSTLSFWGAAGLGRGDVTFTPTGGVSIRTDIDWSMLTGGARGALGNAAALGGASLDWIADALWTDTRSDALLGAPSSATSSDTTRVRAGVEASWAQVLDSGSIQTPRLSLGLRHDGGDAETGLGLEIGGGFDWRDASGGLSFGVEGRALALHDDGDYRDWGVGLNFSYDPRPDTQRGFSMVFTQGLGVSTSGGVTSLMTSGSFPTGFDSSDGESRWSVEASHGANRGLGMVGSPYVRLSGGGTDRMRDLRLGYRVGPDASRASDMNLDIWAEPSTNAGQPVEAGASLRWNW